MNMTKLRSNLILVTTALIWGFAFVAQSVGMEFVGPFTFNSVRSLLGAVVLLPCIALLDKLNKRNSFNIDSSRENASDRGAFDEKKNNREDKKTLFVAGILCGLALFVASSLQQQGIMYTTVGKAGFITSLYIIIVPFIGVFFKRKIPGLIWLSTAIAMVGMYLLCITENFTIGKGDLLILACAVVFSVHILIIERYSSLVDGVRMSCIQFFTCGILSAIPMLIIEKPQLSVILSAWAPILYAGVLSCAVAYTLQIIGQKNTSAPVASLILSLESVFSVLAGWIILGQTLTARELLGCALVFCAIVLAQWPGPVPVTRD